MYPHGYHNHKPHQMREERNSDREREVTQQTRDAAELADLREKLLRLQEENRKLQSKVCTRIVKGFDFPVQHVNVICCDIFQLMH